MPEDSKAHFRRSRSLLGLAFFAPGTALALLSLLGNIGLFWQLVQVTLMGAGALIFLREAKRVEAGSLQSAEKVLSTENKDEKIERRSSALAETKLGVLAVAGSTIVFLAYAYNPFPVLKTGFFLGLGGCFFLGGVYLLWAGISVLRK